MAVLSSLPAFAAPMRVLETCKINKWADGKWETVSGSEFSGTDLETTPNSKNPEFLQFKSGGIIFSAKKACFTEASGEEASSGVPAAASAGGSDSGLVFYGGLGITAMPKDSHEVSLVGSSTTVNGTVSSSFALGLEARKSFSGLFFASGALEFLGYKSTAVAEGNSIFNLVLMPGVSFGKTFQVWAGMGAGLSMISLKGTSDSDGAITVEFPGKSLFALNLSPRIGFALDLGGATILDLMASYNMIGSVKWGGIASAGASSVEVTDTFKISYLGVLLRIGRRF